MRRVLQVGLLTLALAPLSLAQEPSTEWALQGTDNARGRAAGTLVVTLRPDRAFDVDLRVTYADGQRAHHAGKVSGTGRRLEGPLPEVVGLSGAVAGAQAGRTRLVVSIELQAGRCQGTFVTSRSAFFFWGTRPSGVPAGPAHEAGRPAEKQAAVWREASAAPYGALPALGSKGVGENFWDTLAALRIRLLDKTFADASDVRPARTKIFHPFGSVATVAYEAVPGHPYTGLFASDGAGLARLSLATDADTYIPGIALKLFVQGRPSVNIHAIPSFEPQTSRDFFARSPSNVIPEPTAFAIKLFSKIAVKVADPLRRPVDHVAAVNQDGSAVAAPRAPHQLFFRPAEVHFPADSTADFRDLLATIPPGTVIYAVYAGDVHIGNVRTTSRLVASEWGDRVLHFKHER